jgi:hypothetical protein
MKLASLLIPLLGLVACGGNNSSTPPDGRLPTCSGTPVTATGPIAVDVKSIHVTGKVTLSGAALPGAAGGNLIFTETSTNVIATIPVAATYDVALAPGTYTVSYGAGGGGGGGNNCAGPMPCNTGPIKTSVPLQADSPLDLDIPAITVTGTATLAGAAYPTGGNAELSFTVDGGQPANVTLGASFTATLLAGTYEVGYVANGQGNMCSGPTPCNDGSLKTGVNLTASGPLAIDVPAVTINGAITLKGAALPGNVQGRISFAFSGTTTTNPGGGGGGGGGARVNLAPTYTVVLLPGTYDVTFGGTQQQCAAPLPCNSGPLKTGVAIAASGPLNLDIPVTNVTGAITLNGQPLPTGATSQLSFTMDNGGSATIDLAPTYTVPVLPGSYTVSFRGTQDPTCAGPLPCNRGPIVTGAGLSADGALNLDIKAVKVTGNMTVAGAAAPTGTSAGLAFTLTGGRAHSLQLAPTYTATILAGTYDIGYADGGSPCSGAVPCNSGPLKTGVALTADGPLNVDVPGVMVTGTVTLNGAPLPTSAVNRGDIAFALNGGTIAQSAALGMSGPGSYALNVLAGRYLIIFEGGRQLCQPTAWPSLPCMNEIVTGCP